MNPGAYNVKMNSPTTVVTDQLEHTLVELELAELEEKFNNEKNNHEKTLDNLQYEIETHEKEAKSKDLIIQNINSHFNLKVSELHAKVEELAEFKKARL